MHINMKYYIVTIGAIFIALGIGMLVGFNLNYDQELSKQQASLIQDLDNKFEELKVINDTLEKDLSDTSQNYDKAIDFINENSDKLIENQLLDKNIGIIYTSETNDYTKDLDETIVKSNGKIAFNIILKDNIYDATKIQEVSEKLGLDIKNTQDIVNYIIESLKLENAKEKLNSLEELEVIKVNSIDESYINYDSIVLAVGTQEKNIDEASQNLDKSLISVLKEQNKKIVAVQKSDNNSLYIDLYNKDKVTTIDNIEQGIGKISLVITLKEDIKVGKYGILEGTNSILPYKK